jgi:cyclohexanecarboxylate-CoA ligase
VIAWASRDAARAADAYRRGRWVHTTLADSLRAAAETSRWRTALVDGDTRLDCATLYTQATRLANALLGRMPTGSVVSFMLPNWHEAAVIYLAATLAWMVVNPILPSLRDHELLFILEGERRDRVDHPHCLSVRGIRHSLQCRRAGCDSDADG